MQACTVMLVRPNSSTQGGKMSQKDCSDSQAAHILLFRQSSIKSGGENNSSTSDVHRSIKIRTRDNSKCQVVHESHFWLWYTATAYP